ncbi:uncharacterized protein TNCV_2330571 [Trichonephila clavipes]|nr:uncharacterized protein TNCV_2330571 [Trichonephila clavipes]
MNDSASRRVIKRTVNLPSTFESTIAQCLLWSCTSCLVKRAQKLERGELETRVAWSDESRFRLLDANGRLRIWRFAHEAMNSAHHVGTVQGHGGSIMVWGAFSWHYLRSLGCVYQPPSIKFGT